MAAASAPRLYDHTGTEIPLQSPPPSSAVVVPTGVDEDFHDRYRLYPSKNLKPNTIVQILEEADAGDPYRLIELEEEMVEKDGKIESILKSRTSSVLGLKWDVMPPKLRLADQGSEAKAAEIARFCYQALDSCEFSELVADLMDAVGKPFAVDWITWGQDDAGRVVPKLFSRIPTKHLRWAFSSDEIRVFQPSQPGNFTGGEWGEPLPAYQTIRAIDMSRRDHPTRAGVLRTLIWPYLFKLTIIKDMVAYGERSGLPPRVLRIDDQDFDNAERYQKFRIAMRDFKQDLSAVISKNAELDIKVVATKDGVEVFVGQVAYFDKWMAWKVLGHELTSQSSPGQGQLGITAAMDVRQDIKEGDCRWLAGIIKRDLLTPIVGWNFGWDAVAQHLVPTLQFDVELPKDLNSGSQVLDRIVRAFPKLPVSKQWLRDEYGIPAPVGEEEGTPQDDILLSGWGGTGAAGGATGAPDPNANPPGSPADPGTVNAAPARAFELAGPLRITFADEPLTPKQAQEPIDELVRRGTASAQTTSEAWARKLREILQSSAKDGLTFEQTKRRIVDAYPELAVEDLDRTLREQRLLSRLAGRNL